MIHTCPSTIKFKRFCRSLRKELGSSSPVSIETVAKGILESLWHATQTSAPRGDIGRFDDEDIAEMVGWYGDSETIISHLVESGWLDRSEEFRLVVHDWSDHAPNYLKGNIRHKGGFANLPKDERSDCSKDAPKDVPRGNPRDTPKDIPKGGTPNGTERNGTKPKGFRSESEGNSPGRSIARSDPSRESIFRKITPGILSDDRALRDWFLWQLKPPDGMEPVLESGDWLACLEAAEHALGKGKNPAALFSSIVGKLDSSKLSADSKKAALKRFSERKSA